MSGTQKVLKNSYDIFNALHIIEKEEEGAW